MAGTQRPHSPSATHLPIALSLPLPHNDTTRHLLLCASGSVATIKLPNIISALSHHQNLTIRIILTASASNFLSGQSAEQPALESLASLPNVTGVHLDADEWAVPWTRGASILHIELRRWAHLMVIAPLSANTLAKMVAGICDNLLLSTVRAWDTTGELDPQFAIPTEPSQLSLIETTQRKRKIIIVAPAMNTAMWKHPVTKQHMKLLEGDWNFKNGGWVDVLIPIQKELACGDTGDGAMQDWKDIVVAIEDRLGLIHHMNRGLTG